MADTSDQFKAPEDYPELQEQISSLGRQLRTAQGLRLQEQIAGQTAAIQLNISLLTRFNEAIREVQVDGVKLVIPPLAYYTADYILKYFDPDYLKSDPWTKKKILAGALVFSVYLAYHKRINKLFMRVGKFVTQKSGQAISYGWQNKGVVPRAIWRQLSRSTTWPTP